jgi:hypothetical protein
LGSSIAWTKQPPRYSDLPHIMICFATVAMIRYYDTCTIVQVLLSLPEAAPDWLLQGLFTDPFAQALQLVRPAGFFQNMSFHTLRSACRLIFSG